MYKFNTLQAQLHQPESSNEFCEWLVKSIEHCSKESKPFDVTSEILAELASTDRITSLEWPKSFCALMFSVFAEEEFASELDNPCQAQQNACLVNFIASTQRVIFDMCADRLGFEGKTTIEVQLKERFLSKCCNEIFGSVCRSSKCFMRDVIAGQVECFPLSVVCSGLRLTPATSSTSVLNGFEAAVAACRLQGSTMIFVSFENVEDTLIDLFINAVLNCSDIKCIAMSVNCQSQRSRSTVECAIPTIVCETTSTLVDLACRLCHSPIVQCSFVLFGLSFSELASGKITGCDDMFSKLAVQSTCFNSLPLQEAQALAANLEHFFDKSDGSQSGHASAWVNCVTPLEGELLAFSFAP